MTLCRIAVAAHKPCWVPKDPLYLPVQAGSLGQPNLGFTRDCEGENISAANPWRCELTALYWAWKHVEAEYLGLVHYRRYFTLKAPLLAGKEDKQTVVLNSRQLAPLLAEHPIIVPSRRWYCIETRASQFRHAHTDIPLMVLEETLEELFPSYLPIWQRMAKTRWVHLWNMFIMRRDILDAYCSWLFALLDRVEADFTRHLGYVPSRLSGYLAERLLDLWLEANGQRYLELPVLQLDGVNWPLKIAAFIGRKLYNRQTVGSYA